MISVETPLMAADNTTMGKPGWEPHHDDHLGEDVERVRRQERHGLAAEARDYCVEQPDLRLARGHPGVHEAPDDRRADERDRQRQEDERLGQRLTSDAIE